MNFQFLGAARSVTGSMHLLHINDQRILLDCGLFQGKRFESNERNKNFPFDPKSINAVILSHAHIDHSGNLPNLVKQGFTGSIFSTSATKDLCEIMLADYGYLHERDAEFLNKKHRKNHEPLIEPLYTSEDAAKAMKYFKDIPYEEEFCVLKNIAAKFSDAGHILGSASIKITCRENGTKKTLGFSGDIGRWNMPIIRDPLFMGNVETLIMESTYGGKLHDPPEDMETNLANDIERTISHGGKVLVPAFSVGRTQDLAYSLHKLFDKGKLPRIPIYIDSPLAINATEIFKKHPECFDDEAYQHIAQHHDPFGFNQLYYVRTSEESKKLNDKKEPCVIIAASGMCEAGRILHHLANNIEDNRNTILIVGYCAEHTLGRRLAEQAEEVKIYGNIYKRNAEVIVHNSFSAHADNNELLKYVDQFDKKQLKRIFLVHGELDQSIALKKELENIGVYDVQIPSRSEKVIL
ncbi:MAG: MBL fold metallo-hydrolase [Bacteroidota bacterium]|nr:MBL fold metallo-hydrolase [Bacteroidota bacterium]